MYTTHQQYERLKIEILRGVDSYLVGFENETKVMSALEAIERYNNESNEFLKESMLLAYQSANKFIDDWKQIHIAKADKVIKQKEEEKAIQLEKRTKPINIIPKLNKAYSELESLLNEIISLDESVLRNPFNYYSNRKVSNDEIISDFKSMIMETTKGAK